MVLSFILIAAPAIILLSLIQRNNLFSQSECKPYILYPTDDDIVKYNISHDEDIVIAIFNAKSDVGIDIMSKNRIYQLNDINTTINDVGFVNLNSMKSVEYSDFKNSKTVSVFLDNQFTSISKW